MNEPVILVVEDNPTIQMLASLLCKRLTLQAEIASSCEEALAKLDSGTIYALVLMDWSLPDCDGLECTQKIRTREFTRGQHLPVIAMTGHVMPGDKQLCIEAGMDDFLSKPFTVTEFTDMVFKWIGKKDEEAAEGETEAPAQFPIDKTNQPQRQVS